MTARNVRTAALAAGGGALLAYLFDPRSGRRRRTAALHRALAAARHTRFLSAKLRGIFHDLDFPHRQKPPPNDAELAPTVDPAAPNGSVNVRLNTATLEELDTLPGVGPVTARKIIDFRKARGGFTSVDELDAVPGIGPSRLEELRALLRL